MVKRETGESPVRSRHCEPGVQSRVRKLTSLSYREGRFCVRIGEPGNLPAVGTGEYPDHEELVVLIINVQSVNSSVDGFFLLSCLGKSWIIFTVFQNYFGGMRK